MPLATGDFTTTSLRLELPASTGSTAYAKWLRRGRMQKGWISEAPRRRRNKESFS